ncbi:hypothetical protein [Sporosarcina trichiuri]|uniref:hypothetical protein n=1 Tax=Sporosarcina trichiuri TaxID=3056445 RepID=UPI0025B2C4EB|nr:hypothetical protein [Sporosarcina sp. 0.2-SM1T-5]WJY26442.1 hypothetical protein QWT68_10155 [Sporosarcina sp. 0.2-SM1T-5]
MLNQDEVSRKVFILLFAVLLMWTAGTGGSHVLADTSIQGRLIGWFDKQKNQSIQEMDQAITAEKNRLMDRLRFELQLETQRAQAQLAQHTAAETAGSIQELQKYADALSAKIHVSNDSQKAAVSSAVDDALKRAKAIIQGAAVVPEVPPVVQPEPAPSKDATAKQPDEAATAEEAAPAPEAVTPSAPNTEVEPPQTEPEAAGE